MPAGRIARDVLLNKITFFTDIHSSILPPLLVPGIPEDNYPFSIPCFSDVDNQLFPRDAAKFTDISFKWELRVGSENKDYLKEIVSEPGRVKIDPLTGRFPTNS